MNALSDNTIVSAAFSAGLEVNLVKQLCLTRFFYNHTQILKIFKTIRVLEQ